MKNFKHISLGLLLSIFVSNSAFSQYNLNGIMPVSVKHDLAAISNISGIVLSTPFLASNKPLSPKFNAIIVTVSRDENKPDENSLSKKDVIIILLITLIAICGMYKLFKKD